MIPAQISNLLWDDICALIEAGREEDDTIEFKRAFTGGSDFTSLNEKAQKEAVDAIAREVLAFLNTRGGDVVIGISEGRVPPAATEITPVRAPEETAERLARSLAALIEPAQTNVSVRPLLNPDDASTGVIVIRVQASVRAPHRSKRTRECYARRGSESVPMAMDEIQDLTMYRAQIRFERQSLLERQFAGFDAGGVEHRLLQRPFFHVRTVFFPHVEQEMQIGDPELLIFSRRARDFYRHDGTAITNDVVFRQLTGRWRTILRGRKQDFYLEEGEGHKMLLASKRVKSSGIVIYDFAARFRAAAGDLCVPVMWLTGMFAQIGSELAAFADLRPSLLPASIRVGIHASDEIQVVSGGPLFERAHTLPSQRNFFPDYGISADADFESFFSQVQIDLMSLVNEDDDEGFTLRSPSATTK